MTLWYREKSKPEEYDRFTEQIELVYTKSIYVVLFLHFSLAVLLWV